MPTVGKVIRTPCGVEWIIQDVSKLSFIDSYYFSPDFCFARTTWYLRITADSLKRGRCKYIVVGINKGEAGPPVTLECSFSLKTKNGDKCGEKHVKYVFDNVWVEYPITPILERSKFLRMKSELAQDDVLTVVCNMKLIHSEGNNETEKCPHCRQSFDGDIISSHKKRCLMKPIQLDNFYGALSQSKHKLEEQPKTDVYKESQSLLTPDTTKALQDLQHLFLYQEKCDTIVRVKGREFPAHKAILTASSPIFSSLLRNDVKKEKTSIVDIEDVDPSTFSDILSFLYTEEVDNFSEENVFSLYTAANKYKVKDLKGKCIEFIQENLSVDTFCDTIDLAFRHSETELLKLTSDFFIRNASKIIKTVKWKKFVAENPTQGNDLFRKFVASTELPHRSEKHAYKIPTPHRIKKKHYPY